MSDTIGFVMLCNSWTSGGVRESLNVCVCVCVSEEVFTHASMCVTVHVGRWVAMQDKGLSSGDNVAPSHRLSLARSTGTSRLCVCASVCVYFC